MNPITDYSLGKARHQELEAEVRRNAHQQEELLGQVGFQAPPRLASVNLSTVLGIVVVIGVVGAQVLGL